MFASDPWAECCMSHPELEVWGMWMLVCVCVCVSALKYDNHRDTFQLRSFSALWASITGERNSVIRVTQ